MFLTFIIDDYTHIEVRQKALEVLIKNFNQRDILIKEICRTEVIVNGDDAEIHLDFLQKIRMLKSLLTSMMRIEKYSSIVDVPHINARGAKDKIVAILNTLIQQMKDTDPLTRRRLQNLQRHAGLIQDLLENTLKLLVNKEFYYRDLFQCTINYLYQMCVNNPSCQKMLLPDLDYFLDMMN